MNLPDIVSMVAQAQLHKNTYLFAFVDVGSRAGVAWTTWDLLN